MNRIRASSSAGHSFRFLTAVLVCVFWPGSSSAEEPPASTTAATFQSSARPTNEVGGYVGFWNLMAGGGTFGLRYTRNSSSWLGFELEGTGRGPQLSHGRSGLLLGQVRVGVPTRNRPRAFLTAGLAAGRSHHFRLSPVLGIGFQDNLDARGGLRIELQTFRRGEGVDDGGRIIATLFLAW
jgi:hypothetical protein